MASVTNSCLTNDDDKYSKCSTKHGMPGLLASKCQIIDSLSLRSDWDVIAYVRKAQKIPFRSYFLAIVCLLLGGNVVHRLLQGSLSHETIVELIIDYGSAIAEAFGLLSVRLKIEKQRNVSGISGMTMSMYVVVYMLRTFLYASESRWNTPTAVATPVLSGMSILMALDILRAVLKNYRESYQEDLDVLKIKHLIPACLVLAIVVHPDIRRGAVWTFGWTSCLYLDVLALMPQVAMMTKSGGKVEAPIANFVAMTALSRVGDLWFWCCGAHGLMRYSWILIVFFHILHLLLVADFMYYYIRARFAGCGVSEDLQLPVEDLC